MTSIELFKEREILETPLLLFECELASGAVERWSTHRITWNGHEYEPRILRHNAFELNSYSEHGVDSVSKISMTLSNVDSYFSQIERNIGWKGSRLTVRFVFFDLRTNSPATDSVVIFLGLGNPPDEITERTIRLTFANRLNLQRVQLPEVRIQRRCPWLFPSTAQERQVAVSVTDASRYQPQIRCGYSAGIEGGVGNLDGDAPFTSCNYSRTHCEERGMFREDSEGRPTRRFGGIEFVPADILVRTHGERQFHVSNVVDNQARYNDFVPLVYGTAWYRPPIVFARNDGNLTRMEVLLGMGEIEQVLRVVVNDLEIPQGEAGKDLTATGWFNLIHPGHRSGDFNPDFQDASGMPLGDPYGSMAVLSVVVPNRISDGRSLPTVQVLLEGMRLPRYDEQGQLVDIAFTNNPAWVLLDVLRRSGWKREELDLKSFARTAAYCAEQVQTTDLNGNLRMIPRYQCNLAVTRRRSAAEMVRGIRAGAGLHLTFSRVGLLEVAPEATLAIQHPNPTAWGNSTEPLNGGWPVYEFGDGSTGIGGVLRRENGDPAIRLWSRSTADTPNRLSIEFQDEFNEYQQDSLSVVDADDATVARQEINGALAALGVPNFSQAGRVIRTHLRKTIRGNTYVEFETSVKGLGIRPGDLIAITYLKEGLQREPFRVVRVAPGSNYETVWITAQIHDDHWYDDHDDPFAGAGADRRSANRIGLPRPLVGAIANADGSSDFDVEETTVTSSDGTAAVKLSVRFVPPRRPSMTERTAIVGLSPQIDTLGGALEGGQILYYGVSALGEDGSEGGLSFLVRASIGPGSDTNRVTLTKLSLPQGSVGFVVYRGSDPIRLRKIAESDVPATEFVDTGLEASTVGPPDPNYDHANFYWRFELMPEAPAGIHSENTIGDASLHMLPDEYRGMTVRITGGKGAGQEATIEENSESVLRIAARWRVTPDATSRFVVAESSWRFAATATASPVEFEVPNRVDATVHLLGRSANVYNHECAVELSPITRWRIGGEAGGEWDADVAGAPIFGLSVTGRGTAELGGISFEDLTNTRTIYAGTLTLGYWDELQGPGTIALSQAVSDEAPTLTLSEPGPAQMGDWLQIGPEVMRVDEVRNGGLEYEVVRGSHGTNPESHDEGVPIYHLSRKTLIIPFIRNFFGTPASGSYTYRFSLPSVRIAVAELFVTNTRGSSEPARTSFTATSDFGLRTLAGGQYSIQVEGFLAVQHGAAPPVVIDESHSVRDIFARLREAPTDGPLVLELYQDEELYTTLSIPAGATQSNIVSGSLLPPLRADSELHLAILSVSHGEGSNPGRDLTVVVRL
ncbi:MAG: phage tail protein [Bryobacteraceae bacterium]